MRSLRLPGLALCPLRPAYFSLVQFSDLFTALCVSKFHFPLPCPPGTAPLTPLIFAHHFPPFAPPPPPAVLVLEVPAAPSVQGRAGMSPCLIRLRPPGSRKGRPSSPPAFSQVVSQLPVGPDSGETLLLAEQPPLPPSLTNGTAVPAAKPTPTLIKVQVPS